LTVRVSICANNGCPKRVARVNRVDLPTDVNIIALSWFLNGSDRLFNIT